MSDIRVTLVGDDKVKRKLLEVAQRAKNPNYAMKLIANAMYRDVIGHFRDEKGESGTWKNLKPATWKWKEKHGYRQMLQNTGNLRRRNVPESGDDYAAVVNDIEYAKHQNYGDPAGNLPAREFLWLSKQALQGILKLMQGYLMQGL